MDTLQIVDRLSPGPDALAYPRTLGYDADGRLWISDAARHVILSIDSDSNELVPQDTIPDSYPYIAGFREGSVFVFSPAFHRVYELQQGRISKEIDLEGGLPEKGGLRYVTATDSGFAVKVVATDFDGYLAELDREGKLVRKTPLNGPEWRHAGLLRSMGSQIFSLVGYLPMIDTFNGSEVDSLALHGFDSPMLARMLQFRTGNTDEPPLLSSSSVPAGDHWFVLNMRPGWVQVDVYSLEGELQYILTEPNPAFNQDFFPTDLAVFAHPDGGFSISISVIEPEPRVDRYYWRP